MAKVAFTKLNLKLNDTVKTIKWGDQEIEVKQYLPVNEKLELISRVINLSYSEDMSFPNPVKIDIFGTLEIIFAYTNISFTEKQKENPAKLYDLLDGAGLVNTIVEAIPPEEYEFLINGIDDSIDAYYTYRNSVLGILDVIQQDYSNLEYDATNIQQAISNPENLTLVKDILSKLG